MIEEKDPKGNKNIGQKEGEEEDEGYYDENGEFHYYEDEGYYDENGEFHYYEDEEGSE